MFVIGLSGGIGSGKSVVADLLAGHGTYLIDADQVAREVVAPGTAGLSAIVDRFGPSILSRDGSLDRSTLADLVFADAMALADLNAIVHPLVRVAIHAKLAELARTDTIVVLSVPLFVESGEYQCDFLIIVDVDEEVAIQRLVKNRGWTEEHARARVAAQADRQARVNAADYVITNDGSLDDLADRVDQAFNAAVGN